MICLFKLIKNNCKFFLRSKFYLLLKMNRIFLKQNQSKETKKKQKIPYFILKKCFFNQ